MVDILARYRMWLYNQFSRRKHKEIWWWKVKNFKLKKKTRWSFALAIKQRASSLGKSRVSRCEKGHLSARPGSLFLPIILYSRMFFLQFVLLVDRFSYEVPNPLFIMVVNWTRRYFAEVHLYTCCLIGCFFYWIEFQNHLMLNLNLSDEKVDKSLYNFFCKIAFLSVLFFNSVLQYKNVK